MESQLKRQILDWAKTAPDAWLAKYHGSACSLRGHPDLHGHVRGRAVFLELKEPGKQLTPLQAAIGRKIERSGGLFRRIESFEGFLALVENLRALA